MLLLLLLLLLIIEFSARNQTPIAIVDIFVIILMMVHTLIPARLLLF